MVTRRIAWNFILLFVLYGDYGSGEVEVSLDKDCYDNHSLTTAVLTAIYTGSDNVYQVLWYYQHQIAGNFIINANDCAKAGPDNGFPDDRIIFNCIDSKNFTLTLHDINTELGTEWGARFRFVGDNISELKYITILKCDCGFPNITNAQANQRGFLEGATFTISCYEGYTLDGTAEVTCNNGSFTNLPRCISFADCGFPKITNAQANQRGFLEGATFKLSCHEGYPLDGTAEVTCNNGSFTNLPRCISTTDCIFPKITNAQADQYGFEEGATFKLSCHKGYTLDGNAEVKCNNGSFTNLPRCISTAANGNGLSGGTIAIIVVACILGVRYMETI